MVVGKRGSIAKSRPTWNEKRVISITQRDKNYHRHHQPVGAERKNSKRGRFQWRQKIFERCHWEASTTAFVADNDNFKKKR